MQLVATKDPATFSEARKEAVKIQDLTNLPEKRITSFDNVRYPRQVQEKGIVFIASGLTGNISWQPSKHLITARSDHPFDCILTEDLFASIKLATQQALEDVIVYLIRMRAQNVTTHCLRDLLSHGEMMRDSILNTFLAILCAGHNLTYSSTFFITILRRDKKWEPLRNWFATDDSAEVIILKFYSKLKYLSTFDFISFGSI